MTRPLTIAALLVLAALTAAAEDPPAPPLGGALRRAVGAGAITSGTAYFKSSRNGALISVHTVVLPRQQGVRVRVDRQEVGAMRAEITRFGCTLDLDGRTRALVFEYVRGRQRSTMGARVRGTKLLAQDPRGPRILAWDPTWVPFSALFLLPRAARHGLPAASAPTLFHAGTLSPNPKPSRLTHAKGRVVAEQVWIQPMLRDQRVVVSVDARGAITRVELGPETWTPLTPAAARALVPTLDPPRGRK